MSKRASEDALSALHNHLAQALADKIENGTATPADLSVARQFLKDNGINCDGSRNPALNGLVDSLPDFTADDEIAAYN